MGIANVGPLASVANRVDVGGAVEAGVNLAQSGDKELLANLKGKFRWYKRPG